MATYNTLQRGSSGDDVKKLQDTLISAGYRDSSSSTGYYGSKTQAAVKKYQTDNGLSVDGIAGNQTLGKLYGNTTSTQNTLAQSAQQKSQTQSQPTTQSPSYRYDADGDEVYQSALKQLESAKADTPTYAGTYDEQLKAIYDQIMNREKFSYDLNGDALWQQYKDQYQQQGQLAMMDTMGQAAALTGGYGNSYAQNVGQQVYQGYLQQLNDKVPELYQLALSKYQMEGDQMTDQFALTGELAGDEYSKYQDSLTQYWQNVDRSQDAADTAYSRGYDSWYTEQQLQNQEEETRYSRQQDAYNKLAELISSTGYSPSAEELAAAGMSDGQAAAYGKYYNDQKTATSYSGGSGGNAGGTDDYDEEEETESSAIEEFKSTLHKASEHGPVQVGMYGTYKKYLESAIKSAWNAGKLTDDEALQLLGEYLYS